MTVTRRDVIRPRFGGSVEPVVARTECATGASCAIWAFGRAIGAARASGAAARVSRNEQVVGSIPTGGSLFCRSVTVIDLNFDCLSISVERFAERVVWSGRPDERVSWLRSVIDGRVSVPLASGDPTRSRQPAECRGRASRPRQPGSSVRNASCASRTPSPARHRSGGPGPKRTGALSHYALGVLGLGSLLLTQVRYEHPASIKDAEAQELATREAADMRLADSASAQLIRDGLDGLPADPTGLN